MKKVVLSSILVIASFSWSAAAQSGSVGDAAARAEVMAATAAWGAAYDSRDPQKITALYDPEAVFWGTTARAIATTPQMIAEYFRNAGNRPDARVIINERHVRVYGDVAISSGSYTFTDVRDGQPTSNPSRFTFVFVKRNGQWRIIDHHSSRVP